MHNKINFNYLNFIKQKKYIINTNDIEKILFSEKKLTKRIVSEDSK